MNSNFQNNSSKNVTSYFLYSANILMLDVYLKNNAMKKNNVEKPKEKGNHKIKG